MHIKCCKKAGLQHMSRKYIFGKPKQGMRQIDPPIFLGLKEMNKTKLYVHYKKC